SDTKSHCFDLAIVTTTADDSTDIELLSFHLECGKWTHEFVHQILAVSQILCGWFAVYGHIAFTVAQTHTCSCTFATTKGVKVVSGSHITCLPLEKVSLVSGLRDCAQDRHRL